MKHYSAKESTNTLANWQCSQDKIERIFKFNNFSECFAFMTRVAFICEAKDHHPKWTNVYNSLYIELNTHSENAVTQKDIELALAIDQLL